MTSDTGGFLLGVATASAIWLWALHRFTRKYALMFRAMGATIQAMEAERIQTPSASEGERSTLDSPRGDA